MLNVVIQSNIFSNEKKHLEMQAGASVAQIIMGYGYGKTKGYPFVMVNDEKIEDFGYIPKDNDLVLIKIIPMNDPVGGILSAASWVSSTVAPAVDEFLFGGDQQKYLTTGTSWDIILGGALILSGFGGIYGLYLWASLLRNGLNNLNASAPSTDVEIPMLKEVNFASGGNNRDAKDTQIPVILGRTRYYPFSVAVAYSDISTPSWASKFNTYEPLDWKRASIATVFSKGALLWGHKEVVIETDTLKLGNTPITNNANMQFQIAQNASLYPKIIKTLNVNQKLKEYSKSTGFTEHFYSLGDGYTNIIANLNMGHFYSKNIYNEYESTSTIFSVKLYKLEKNGTRTLLEEKLRESISSPFTLKNADTVQPSYFRFLLFRNLDK